MEILHTFIDFFLHLDHHMSYLITNYGLAVYGILFAIIFCETGLVVTPFLPGDSLLFVLGAFAARGELNLFGLFVLLTVAAILGDACNYFIGTLLKDNILQKKKIAFIKPEYLTKTSQFYEKYGNKTIVLARFVPIIRTFAPFLAGVANMSYARFGLYNIVGGLLWITIGLGAGYIFGNLPWVEKNFSLVVLGVVVISVIPIVLEVIKKK